MTNGTLTVPQHVFYFLNHVKTNMATLAFLTPEPLHLENTHKAIRTTGPPFKVATFA